LPRWAGCAVLSADQIFVMNQAPASLDSRYFGPLSRSSILGRAVPLWTRGRRH
jgi:type IV secretory pathway protease TraF